MEKLTDAVRAMFPPEKDPVAIEERLEVLSTRKVDVVDGIEISPVSAIPVKVSVILQVGIRRMIELSNSTIRETNLQNLSSMCVVGRSAFETACLLYDVVGHVKEYVDSDKPAGIEEIDKYLVQILLGHKSKDWAISEEIEARNVLGIIRRLDKDEFGEMLMWFYDGLSEHAHPNYHGMLATYSIVKGDRDSRAITRFTDRRPGRDKATTIHVVSSLEIALGMVTLGLARYEEYGDRFSALAERFIYERGTWPADEPYPVMRVKPGDAPWA